MIWCDVDKDIIKFIARWVECVRTALSIQKMEHYSKISPRKKSVAKSDIVYQWPTLIKLQLLNHF